MSAEHTEYEEFIKRQDESIMTTLPQFTQGILMYGKETMNSLLLLSGGSAAALLAFIGHLTTSGMKESAKGLALPLCVFVVAAIFAVGGMGFSYLSQGKGYQAQLVLLLGRDNKRSELFWQWAYVWLGLAVLCVFASFAGCLGGVWLAYWAFMNL